jgi:hypothetical protein
VEDAEILKQNRVAFVSDAVGKQVDSLLEERIRTYFNDHLGPVLLLATWQRKTGKLLWLRPLYLYHHPRPVCPNGKCGLLVNVNTGKGLPPRGIATRMLKALFEEAKQMGVERIELDYTEDGYRFISRSVFKSWSIRMPLSL